MRCYAKPPAYDGRLVRFSIDCLPYLLALHLFVGVIIFGNTDVFPSGVWQRRGVDEIQMEGITAVVRIASYFGNGRGGRGGQTGIKELVV